MNRQDFIEMTREELAKQALRRIRVAYWLINIALGLAYIGTTLAVIRFWYPPAGEPALWAMGISILACVGSKFLRYYADQDINAAEENQ